MDLLGGQTDVLLQRALDGADLRHRAIAENVANADTPGYKRLDVEFQEALKAALDGEESRGVALVRTNPRHLPGGPSALANAEASVYRVSDTTGRADGNNVDPDSEMAKLAENTMLYDTLTQVLGRRLSMLRSAINEGKR